MNSREARRKEITDLRLRGLSNSEIAETLGITASLVSYYTGDRRADELLRRLQADSTEPLPEAEELLADLDTAPVSDREASLQILRQIRDGSYSNAERTKAATVLLSYSDDRVQEWEPGEGDLKAFLSELLERRPELAPESLRIAPGLTNGGQGVSQDSRA